MKTFGTRLKLTVTHFCPSRTPAVRSYGELVQELNLDFDTYTGIECGCRVVFT